MPASSSACEAWARGVNEGRAGQERWLRSAEVPRQPASSVAAAARPRRRGQAPRRCAAPPPRRPPAPPSLAAPGLGSSRHSDCSRSGWARLAAPEGAGPGATLARSAPCVGSPCNGPARRRPTAAGPRAAAMGRCDAALHPPHASSGHRGARGCQRGRLRRPGAACCLTGEGLWYRPRGWRAPPRSAGRSTRTRGQREV